MLVNIESNIIMVESLLKHTCCLKGKDYPLMTVSNSSSNRRTSARMHTNSQIISIADHRSLNSLLNRYMSSKLHKIKFRPKLYFFCNLMFLAYFINN